MNILFEEVATQVTIEQMIASLMQVENINGVVVYICGTVELHVESFSTFLKTLPKPVSGGIFPAVVYQSRLYENGVLILGLHHNVETCIVEALNKNSLSLESQLDVLRERIPEESLLMLFFDGLTSGIENFKEELYFNIGLSYQFIGGGTGTLDFSGKPSVITNRGVLKDAAVIMGIEQKAGIGVAHGWEPISEELKVSRSDKNKIYELNGLPAQDVYLKTIFELTGETIQNNHFFDLAKKYPFGISKFGSEMVVRDPIEIHEDGSIVCVGEIPNQSFIHILTGTTESLLNGAKQAKNNSEEDYFNRTKAPYVRFIIDCISRVLYLGDHFQEELNVIEDDALIGALTLGEMANSGSVYLEHYNKTIVIGMMEA